MIADGVVLRKMHKNRQLSEHRSAGDAWEKRKVLLIVTASELGMSVREIGRSLGISHSTVHNILKKQRETAGA